MTISIIINIILWAILVVMAAVAIVREKEARKNAEEVSNRNSNLMAEISSMASSIAKYEARYDSDIIKWMCSLDTPQQKIGEFIDVFRKEGPVRAEEVYLGQYIPDKPTLKIFRGLCKNYPDKIGNI